MRPGLMEWPSAHGSTNGIVLVWAPARVLPCKRPTPHAIAKRTPDCGFPSSCALSCATRCVCVCVCVCVDVWCVRVFLSLHSRFPWHLCACW